MEKKKNKKLDGTLKNKKLFSVDREGGLKQNLRCLSKSILSFTKQRAAKTDAKMVFIAARLVNKLILTGLFRLVFLNNNQTSRLLCRTFQCSPLRFKGQDSERPSCSG